MAALNRKLYTGFQKASLLTDKNGIDPSLINIRKKEAHGILQQTWLELMQTKSQTNLLASGQELKSNELLVLAGEAAIANQCMNIAHDAVKEFHNSNPAEDQFLCRIYFIQALLQADETKIMTGAKRVRGIQLSIEFILKAMKIIETQDNLEKYSFLLYNASLHYWNISRCLFRQGEFKYLVPSMAQICDGLEKIEDGDLKWRSQYLSALAMAYDDAGLSGQATMKMAISAAHAKRILEDEKNKVNVLMNAMKECDQLIDTLRTKIRNLEDREDELLLLAQQEEDNPTDAIEQQEEEEDGSKGSKKSKGKGGKKGGGNDKDSSKADNSQQTEEKSESDMTLEEIVLLRKAKQLDLVNAELQAPELEKQIEQGMKLVKLASVSYENLLLQKIYISRNTNDAESKKSLDQAKSESLAVSATKTMKVNFALQCIRCGITNPVDAAKEIESLCDSLLDPPQASSSQPPIVLSPQEEKDNLELIVDIGLVALREMENIDMAKRIFQYMQTSKSPSPIARVKLDYLKCLILAKEELVINNNNNNNNNNSAENDSGSGGMGQTLLDAKKMEAMKLAKRVEALKMLERALTAARRFKDAVLLQQGCIIAWNLAIPLLQPHLRKHTYRALSMSSMILEDLQSTEYQLRSQIHFEVGKIEFASDFWARAIIEITKAYEMDYGEIDEEELNAILDDVETDKIKKAEKTDAEIEDHYESIRKYDKFIKPLKDKLELKSQIFEEPSSDVEKAILLVEQCKDAADKNLQQNLLIRASALLEKERKERQTDATPRTVETEESGDVNALGATIKDFVTLEADGSEKEAMVFPDPLLKKATYLWADIGELAWKHKMITLVQKSSLCVLENAWNVEKNREFVDTQVSSQYLLGESIVEQINAFKTKNMPIFFKGVDFRTLGVECSLNQEEYTDLRQLKVAVIGTFTSGMKRANRIKALHLIENGATLLWNYHLFSIKNNLHQYFLPEFVTALETAVILLRENNSECYTLLALIAECLCLYYEFSGDTAKAAELCTSTIPNCRAFMAKPLVEIQARLNGAPAGGGGGKKGGKESGKKGGAGDTGVVEDPDTKFYEILNILSTLQLNDTLTPEAKIQQLERCVEIMSEDRTLAIKTKEENMPLPYKNLDEQEDAIEYRTELWSRLAKEYIGLNLNRKAQMCCEYAIEVKSIAGIPLEEIKSRNFRWFSIAECLWGEAIVAMVDTKLQEKALQDDLRLAASRHLVLAANYGRMAKMPKLVLDAALHFWNITLPMMSSNIGRALLFPIIKQILEELGAVGEKTAMSFRVQLYTVLFECYADKVDWRAGIKEINGAFEFVPNKFQKPIWQWKIIMMSKMGKPVLDGMSKMKESNPVAMAKVWVSLARTSTNAKQQLSAYCNALEKIGGRFEKIDVLLEIAEWMVSRGISRYESLDLINTAINTIIDVENSTSEFDDGDKSEFGLQSERSIGQSKAGSSVRSKTSRPTGTSKSQVSSSAASRSTNATGKSKSGGKNNGEEENPDGYPDKLSIEHFEILVRGFIMKAMLVGNYETRSDNCLQACYYIKRIINMQVNSMNGFQKNNLYSELSEEEKKETTFENFTVDEEKVIVVPETDFEFATWVLPMVINVVDAANTTTTTKGKINKCAISTETIKRSPLTMFYLLWLVDELSSLHMHIMALYALVFADLIAEYATKEQLPYLKVLIRCKKAKVLFALGLTSNALDVIQQEPGIGITNLDAEDYMSEIEEIESHKKENPNEELFEEGDDQDGSGTTGLKITKFEARHIWAQLADVTLDLGHVRIAQEYLIHASRQNNAYMDHKNISKCSELRGKIEYMEGRYNSAMSHVLMAQKEFLNKGNSADWYRSTKLLVEIYVKNNEGQKALRVLKEAREILQNKILDKATVINVPGSTANNSGGGGVNTNSFSAASREPAPITSVAKETNLDSLLAWARCSIDLAKLWANTDIIEFKQGYTKDFFEEGWDACFQILSQVEDLLLLHNKHPLLIEIETCRADVMMFALETLSVYKARTPKLEQLQEVLKCLNSAKLFANNYYSNIHKPELLTPDGSSLPITRLLAQLYCKLAKLHLTIAPMVNECISKLKEEEEKIASVNNPADLWLLQTGHKDEPSDEDLDVTHSQCALALTTTAINLGKNCPILVSEANAILGKALSYIAMREGSIDETIWIASEEKVSLTPTSSAKSLKEEKKAAKGGGKGGGKGEPAGVIEVESDVKDKSFMENKELCGVILKESLDSSIELECWDTVAYAANSLINMYGMKNKKELLNNILLYQSCYNRKFLLNTFLESSEDNNRQKVFMTSRDYFSDISTYPRPSELTSVKIHTEFLNSKSKAWQRLKCSESVNTIIEQKLPAHTYIMTIQLSSDLTHLFVGICGIQGKIIEIVRVPWSVKDRRKLIKLEQRLKDFMKDVDKYCLLYGDEIGVFGDAKTNPAIVNVDNNDNNNNNNDVDNTNNNNNNTETKEKEDTTGTVRSRATSATAVTEFPYISDETEDEFVDILKQFEELFFDAFTTDSNIITDTIAQLTSNTADMNLVLLVDHMLQTIPFEGFKIFSKIPSLSRDFSIHLFNHRLSNAIAMTNAKADPECKNADTVFIVDSRNEDKGSAVNDYPREDCITSFDNVKKLYGGAWKGITGSDHVASLSDWQESLHQRTGGSFIYYGPGRCLAQYPSKNLTGTNIDGCQSVLILCLTDNDTSYRRQSKRDTSKDHWELVSEGTLQQAVLFSLTGINTIVMNRWGSSFHANERFLNRYYESTIKNKKSIGFSVRQSNLTSITATNSEGESKEIPLKERYISNRVLYGIPGMKII